MKIIREPLFHFLLAGVALFVLFSAVNKNRPGFGNSDSEILISEGRIYSITQKFAKVWQRPPTEKEVKGLIQNYIREEILYREALAMGLDRDDTIVRRRMRQKMEFISDDIARLDEPTVQDLQAYLTKHQEDYRQPSRFSFRQIYFNTSKRGESAQSAAMSLLAKLKAQDKNANTDTMGDPLMVKHQFNNETEREITRVLGEDFLKALREIPVGDWQGPIRSGFGLHLVHIDENIAGKASELNEVRELVVRDLNAEKRKQTNEMFYENLRKGYTVKVENYTKKSSASENTTSLSMKEAAK